MHPSLLSPNKSNNKHNNPLQNVAILSRVVPFIATGVKRLVHLSFTTTMWSDCIANYSKSTWDHLFSSSSSSPPTSTDENQQNGGASSSSSSSSETPFPGGYEARTAERLAMRSCNLGLFEIARVVAGNPAAARLRDSSGWSCLHQASFCGRPGTCTLLLQVAETEVNALTFNGWTPARCAVYNSDTSVMKVLCRDPRTDVNIPCNDGDTPLLACIAAANVSRLEMMEAILATVATSSSSLNANQNDDDDDNAAKKFVLIDENERKRKIVNYQNNKTGLSAIFVAVKNRDERAVEILLKYGADLELKDKWNRTPLMFVAGAPEVVSLPMVKLLLDKGAKIYPSSSNARGDEDYMVDSKGNNVFDVVKSPKVKKLLEEAAAKEFTSLKK